MTLEKSVGEEKEGCVLDDDDQEKDSNRAPDDDDNEEEYHNSDEEDYASDEEYYPEEEDYASREEGCFFDDDDQGKGYNSTAPDDHDDDNEEEYQSDEDEEGEDYASDGENVMEFTILNSKDIRGRIEGNIVEISTLLSVTRAAAIILLCKYRWDVSRIPEEWFTDEVKVRNGCGLILENPSTKRNGDGNLFFCGICLEDYDDHHAVMAACGHVFCQTCLKTYIYTAIKYGPGCLLLKCPEPSCGAIISEDMIDLLASDEDKVKYENCVLRSYIENRKNIKWCPFPDCDLAVECLDRTSNSSGDNFKNFDVTCHCSYGFCWNCSEEAHSPADCKTASKWILKNSSEAENTKWILANTKNCPKCRRSIEKNQGCMHMICRSPCRFEFCWLCLAPWKGHGRGCNRYESAKRNGDYDKSERIRDIAKKSLHKYTHYYERWSANNKSWEKALSDVKILRAKHLEKWCEILSLTAIQIEFIVDAWIQIVECRRVLKWTYAYGYFLPENDPTRKKFFEYLQGEAEAGLERLHHCVEKELFVHIKHQVPLEEFKSFRTKLVNLTKVTRNYFDNLVRALENGLSDVN